MSTSEVITMASAYTRNDYLHYTPGIQSMELGMQSVASHVSGGYQIFTGNGVDIDNRAQERPAATEPNQMGNGQDCQRKFKLTDFKLITTLGTGTFARVWLVTPEKAVNDRDGSSPELYALKVLRKSDVIRLKQCEHTRNERSILQQCRKHPFITRFVDSWSDWNSLYILLEYAPGGELFSYLRKNIRFPISTTRIYAAEITSVFAFLHSNGVVYRDLKPENVMIDARGHIRLVDFGFSKRIGNYETYTLCGTPEYIAPEVLLTKGHTKAVDWWALGVFVFELSCGYPPFYDSSPNKIYEKIINTEIQFPQSLELPKDYKDLVSGLCTKDLSSRLGNLRDGSDDVKNHPFFRSINWEDLESKRDLGPIIPNLSNPNDTSCFDSYPSPPPHNPDDYTLQMYDRWENHFRDF